MKYTYLSVVGYSVVGYKKGAKQSIEMVMYDSSLDGMMKYMWTLSDEILV